MAVNQQLIFHLTFNSSIVIIKAKNKKNSTLYLFLNVQVRNGLNLVTNREGAPFHPQSLQCLIDPWFESLLQECWSNWQLGNHDNTRVASRIGSEYIDLANTLNLLLSGTTVTYYGEEIGMVDLGKDKISYEDCQDEFGKRMGVIFI